MSTAFVETIIVRRDHNGKVYEVEAVGETTSLFLPVTAFRFEAAAHDLGKATLEFHGMRIRFEDART